MGGIWWLNLDQLLYLPEYNSMYVLFWFNDRVSVIMLNMSRLKACSFEFLLCSNWSSKPSAIPWLVEDRGSPPHCWLVPCGLYQSLIELSWTNISDWKLTFDVWCEEILYEAMIASKILKKTFSRQDYTEVSEIVENILDPSIPTAPRWLNWFSGNNECSLWFSLKNSVYPAKAFLLKIL